MSQHEQEVLALADAPEAVAVENPQEEKREDAQNNEYVQETHQNVQAPPQAAPTGDGGMAEAVHQQAGDAPERSVASQHATLNNSNSRTTLEVAGTGENTAHFNDDQQSGGAVGQCTTVQVVAHGEVPPVDAPNAAGAPHAQNEAPEFTFVPPAATSNGSGDAQRVTDAQDNANTSPEACADNASPEVACTVEGEVQAVGEERNTHTAEVEDVEVHSAACTEEGPKAPSPHRERKASADKVSDRQESVPTAQSNSQVSNEFISPEDFSLGGIGSSSNNAEYAYNAERGDKGKPSRPCSAFIRYVKACSDAVGAQAANTENGENSSQSRARSGSGRKSMPYLRALSEKWNALTSDEKKPYMDAFSTDYEVYKERLREYYEAHPEEVPRSARKKENQGTKSAQKTSKKRSSKENENSIASLVPQDAV